MKIRTHGYKVGLPEGSVLFYKAEANVIFGTAEKAVKETIRFDIFRR